MKNDERREYIYKLLQKNNELRVKELLDFFDVSQETIRLDLDFLENKGLVRRAYGKVIYNCNNVEVPFEVRKKENRDIKNKLTKEAIKYIPDSSTIFIAASSTNLYLSKYLRIKKNLTIFTNSIEFLNLMIDSKHSLYIVGGEIYKNGLRSIGSYASDMIKDIHFDLCICSMDGCKNMTGPGTKSQYEHIFIKNVIKNSQKKMLLSDSTKFNIFANYQFAEFSDFDYVIVEEFNDETISIPSKKLIKIKKDDLV